MSRRRGLYDAWSRFGTEVMSRMPLTPAGPRQITDWMRAPTRFATDLHDAWLESVGGVSRTKYLELLEENLQLRRRLDQLDVASPQEHVAEAATGAMDDAFDRMRAAQDQWLSMWLPKKEGGGPS